MLKLAYTKGQLSGKGKYDVKRHASDIYFFASDIDSNEVATNIFNFKDQINGSAFATLHLKTKDKLKITFHLATKLVLELDF